MSNTPARCKGDGKSVHKLDKCMREWNIYSSRWKLQAYLINTRTHCRTPATPVQTEGPLFVSTSCTNKPTDPARQTKETTYATKSQSFTLQCKETKVRIFYAGITGKNPSYTLNSIWAHSSTQKLVQSCYRTNEAVFRYAKDMSIWDYKDNTMTYWTWWKVMHHIAQC